MSAADLIAQGNRLLDEGQLARAADRYREAMAREPRSLPAAVNLGFVLLELARPEEARQSLSHALSIDPTHADALFMLGRLALEQHDKTGAAQHLTRLVEAHPSFALAYPVLCRALVEADDPARARQVVEAGLAIDPASADLYHALGNLHLIQGDAEAAANSYREALRLDPRRADSRASLGNAQLLLGHEDPAREQLFQALADRPASAEGCHLLATALQALGQLDAAVTAYGMALENDPRYAASQRNLGILHQARGRADLALACFKKLTLLQPDLPRAWNNLGTAHQDLRQYDAAESCYRRALALDPRDAQGHAQLGVLAVDRGATTEALAHFAASLELDPDPLEVRSNQLWALCYGADPAQYLASAREFGRRAGKLAQPWVDWLVEPAHRAPRPQPLRVGLVSGDLRTHPVGYFIESVLKSLAVQGIELHAFPTSAHVDEVSARLKQRCASWTSLVGMYDEVAARRIRDQRIHVLLDLAGHTAHNRLRVFAWRPAPVQASWLGFFASTGVETMDYLLADEPSVPDALLGQFTETVWRLPHTRLCFTPPAAEADFPVAPAPATQRGHITFGCYQNLSKVSNAVLEAWRRILQAQPAARLRLQSKQTGESGRAQVLARLQAAGIPLDRVLLAPPASRASYLASYAEVDLLLDTFPFPGGTTTCEALWMGVPTVTLAGDSMMANQGKALLTCAGLPDWVAYSQDEYVAQAVARASDIEALAALRARLRKQVLASPLFDGERFAADLAQALFGMWQRGPKAAVASEPC